MTLKVNFDKFCSWKSQPSTIVPLAYQEHYSPQVLRGGIPPSFGLLPKFSPAQIKFTYLTLIMHLPFGTAQELHKNTGEVNLAGNANIRVMCLTRREKNKAEESKHTI